MATKYSVASKDSQDVHVLPFATSASNMRHNILRRSNMINSVLAV